MLSKLMQRSAMSLKTAVPVQRAVIGAHMPRRNVSLLVNSQGLTEEQQMIQEMAYKFAAEELEPHAALWDKTKHFPVD